jgi:hypothetical protein
MYLPNLDRSDAILQSPLRKLGRGGHFATVKTARDELKGGERVPLLLLAALQTDQRASPTEPPYVPLVPSLLKLLFSPFPALCASKSLLPFLHCPRSSPRLSLCPGRKDIDPFSLTPYPQQITVLPPLKLSQPRFTAPSATPELATTSPSDSYNLTTFLVRIVFLNCS